MKKFIFAVLVLFLFIGCSQKQTKPAENIPSTIESAENQQQQACTERWICINENTKAYRKSDCTFEQVTDCPAGCENSDCKALEQPKTEVPKEEPKEIPQETKKTCEIGWKCLDTKRLGYQSSNCIFDNVRECQYGCKDNACITTAPPEENKEETFTLTEGKAVMGDLGSKYCDFSKKQIFQKEVYDADLKIILYSASISRDYFRVESPTSELWVVDKGIKEATRSDCIIKYNSGNAFGELHSGKILCLKTKENNIALLGGYWEKVPYDTTELSWKYYS